MKIALFMLFLTVNIRNLIFEKQGRIMSGAYMRGYRVLMALRCTAWT